MKRTRLIRRASVISAWFRGEPKQFRLHRGSDVAVRADVKIPDRRITMTWLLRRNIDHPLPASYTIEMMFDLPADFPGGGVASVPGVLMKRSDQEPGTPLGKVAARATNGVFIIEFFAANSDEQRNVQILRKAPGSTSQSPTTMGAEPS